MGDKTIAVIGVSDQETAHLRLLMRHCAAELEHRWRWGDESAADLVVVDLAAFAGRMAHTRALGTGVRCAVFADRPSGDDELVLRRPLQRADVIAVLNRAGHARARNPAIEAHDEHFYTRHVGEDAGPVRRADAAAPAAGLDDLLRPLAAELRRGAGVAAPTAVPVLPPDAGIVAMDAPLASAEPAHGLRAYLDGDLLRAPVRFCLPGAPPLVLDPKNRVAHTPGSLGQLEPYCRARWRASDWQQVPRAELADLREAQPAQSYARLAWLDVLLHSGGQLARHLHPGGIYRLKHAIDLDRGLEAYQRIASAMREPARLHEIAAASGVAMADVFDFVNASDAIGLIEWRPRPRDDEAAAPTSLLKKLRLPFGRS
ncbi:MAG: hypothetical protein GXC76_15270 [Rhodanobacteraceae bacterium]|nr:hypothetical protein [Rhodanobacteraceae bacterium]